MALAPNASVATVGAPLKLSAVSHRYGVAKAVDNVDLDICGGELVAFLGPSGCGKTTLLRAIGGFISQTEGKISIAGEAVDHLPPNKRAVGIVFQNYALFPHMTAAQNIAYGLEARSTKQPEANARVEEMLNLVKLGAFAGRYPKEMSGGQQQRVALARALAVRPAILLLDEPFAALDKNLRLDMQIEIKRIQRLAGTTTLIVTHDQEEALSMADRVAVFNQGRLEQFATPSEIYDAPQTLFVNTFVGAANTLNGVVKAVADATVTVRLDSGSDLVARAIQLPPPSVGNRVVVCIRQEQLRFSADKTGIAGTVEVGLPLGSMIVHEIRLEDGKSVKISQSRDAGAQLLPPGTSVALAPSSPRAATVFLAD
jgi:putative spermidine/putrescine transport system ATP-binding protein